ncbi:hypothetical protein GCM10009733_083310 [Nonomuraea maheshkhaliensis]|uniref:Uncharacterized protein n=1 Tax=Nonomuraea maheshkhaliensis TaxID=419590 RepID=A0ABN2GMI1_9ACTN
MRSPRKLPALATAAITVMSMGAPAAAQLEPISYIYNKPGNQIGIGVYQNRGQRPWTDILPAGGRTDSHLGWQKAGGFYIGPGYCADPYYYSEGQWMPYGVTVRGPDYFDIYDFVGGERTSRNEIRSLRRGC